MLLRPVVEAPISSEQPSFAKHPHETAAGRHLEHIVLNLTMQVNVKLIATYIQHLPSGTNGNLVTVDVLVGSTVRDVLAPFGIPLDDSSVIVLNGLTVDLNTPVSEGDTISAFSAIAGG